MKTQDPLIFTINFTCQCGNDKSRKFIKTMGVEDKQLEILCVLCEKRYQLQLISKEKAL